MGLPGRSSSQPLHVTSLNPIRDAKTIGHDVGVSRAVTDAKSTALQYRYRKLLADAATAEGALARELRLDGLLVYVGSVCDAIADDIGSLAAMTGGEERRDQIVRELGDELIALVELSTGRDVAATGWRDALAQLRALAEALIRSDERSAEQLADLDLVLERIDHAEVAAAAAFRSYLGYLSA